MTKTKLHGVVVPLVTPVDNNEQIDEKALRKLVRFLIDAGVHGLLAGSCWVSGTKYALSTVGIGNGNPLSPLQPLDLKQKTTIHLYCNPPKKGLEK